VKKMKAELRLINNETAAMMATASVEDLTAALAEAGQHLVLVTPNLRRLHLRKVLQMALERAEVAEQVDGEEDEPVVKLGGGTPAKVEAFGFGWLVGQFVAGGGVHLDGVQFTREVAVARCPPGDSTWFVVPVKPGQTLVVGEKWPGLFFPADYQKAADSPAGCGKCCS